MMVTMSIWQVAATQGNGEEETVDIVSDLLHTQMKNNMPIGPHNSERP
jgi:hypothetical protein